MLIRRYFRRSPPELTHPSSYGPVPDGGLREGFFCQLVLGGDLGSGSLAGRILETGRFLLPETF